MKGKRLTFTVINDLTYDQRMQRICRSLAEAGYEVTLIGRKLSQSTTLKDEPFRQKRLNNPFSSGKRMYLFFNLRLLFYLLAHSTDVICAIDLDTIMPCYLASRVKRWIRVYDAHELFTEQKEIVTRPRIHALWLRVERFAVPRFINGYTVNRFIREELKRRYNIKYEVIQNMPVMTNGLLPDQQRFILYQGAVNEGRSFETLIPAMITVNAPLVICGDGNYMQEVKRLILEGGLSQKVELRGAVAPEKLRAITPTAFIAVTLFEKTGLNQYHSLANRFFDYIMAGVPQVCVNYPEYKAINDQFGVALLIDDTSTTSIANALNLLLTDKGLHETIRQNCLKARLELNWSVEEDKLIKFYENLLQSSLI